MHRSNAPGSRAFNIGKHQLTSCESEPFRLNARIWHAQKVYYPSMELIIGVNETEASALAKHGYYLAESGVSYLVGEHNRLAWLTIKNIEPAIDR